MRNEFKTTEQNKYVKSLVRRKVVGETAKFIERPAKELRAIKGGGLFNITVRIKRSPAYIPIKRYQEKKLETAVTCDKCGCEFAIYGVFASCPYCKNLNALTVFKKSIEAAKKRITLIESINSGDELEGTLLEDALSGGVSAFDALGKFLRSRFPQIFPEKPKNLFQNLTSLDSCLRENLETSLTDILGEERHGIIVKMFQVRHIYEHNLGVIDEDFIRKLPEYSSQKGRIYTLEADETSEFLDVLLKTGRTLIVSIVEYHEEP